LFFNGLADLPINSQLSAFVIQRLFAPSSLGPWFRLTEACTASETHSTVGQPAPQP